MQKEDQVRQLISLLDTQLERWEPVITLKNRDIGVPLDLRKISNHRRYAPGPSLFVSLSEDSLVACFQRLARFP
jgi:hypothetical protein